MEADCEDIFTMIESAIFSAESEYPHEFSVRRLSIAELLFTVSKESSAPYNSSQQSFGTSDGEVTKHKSNTQNIPTQEELIGQKTFVVPTADQVSGKVGQESKPGHIIKKKNTKEGKEQPHHIIKTKKTKEVKEQPRPTIKTKKTNTENVPTKEELDLRLLELYHRGKHPVKPPAHQNIGHNTSPVKPTTDQTSGKVEEERKHLIFKIRLRPKEGHEHQKPTSDRVALKQTTIPSINTASPVQEKSSAGLIKETKAIINKGATVHQEVQKRARLDDEACQLKFEDSKKKLRRGYQQVQEAKDKKKIQMIDLGDLPRQAVERCSTQKLKRPAIRTRFY